MHFVEKLLPRPLGVAPHRAYEGEIFALVYIPRPEHKARDQDILPYLEGVERVFRRGPDWPLDVFLAHSSRAPPIWC